MSAGTSIKTYIAVFAALLVLLVVTVVVAYIHLGTLGVAAALTIATIKSLLVMTWFMHLKDSDRLNWVMAASGFFFLLILLGITWADFAARP